MKNLPIVTFLFLLILMDACPTRAVAQESLELQVSTLEQRVFHLEHENRNQDTGGASMGLLACAALLALWAQNTERNPWLWFFLGLIFSVITVFVMLYKNANNLKASRRF
jgi:hypothetical protein